MEQLRKLIIEARETIKELWPVAKAVVTFVGGLVGVTLMALRLSQGGFTADEVDAILMALLVVLGTTGAVWRVPNKGKQ